VHIVGFNIRIYRDARSHERQKGCVYVRTVGGGKWILIPANETYSQLLNNIKYSFL